VPVGGVVPGDARLHREHLEQGVEFLDGVGVAAGRAVFEDVAQAALGAAEHGDVLVDDLVAHPGLLVGEQGLQPGEVAQLRVDEVDRGTGVRIEVHPTKVAAGKRRGHKRCG
jgi:hypothetical protein